MSPTLSAAIAFTASLYCSFKAMQLVIRSKPTKEQDVMHFLRAIAAGWAVLGTSELISHLMGWYY